MICVVQKNSTDILVGDDSYDIYEDWESPFGDLMKQSHDSLIRRLIDHFRTQDFRISFANYEGFTKPFIIKRCFPDVIGVNRSSGLVHIGIVKYCSSLYDEITKEEFEDFSNILMKGSTTEKILVPFYIAVPNECQSKIKEIFRHFEIPWQDNIHVLGF